MKHGFLAVSRVVMRGRWDRLVLGIIHVRSIWFYYLTSALRNVEEAKKQYITPKVFLWLPLSLKPLLAKQ